MYRYETSREWGNNGDEIAIVVLYYYDPPEQRYFDPIRGEGSPGWPARAALVQVLDPSGAGIITTLSDEDADALEAEVLEHHDEDAREVAA